MVLTTVALGFIQGIKVPNANFLQLEPTDLQMAARAELAQNDQIALSETTAELERSEDYGWNALLIPTNFAMAACGVILLLFVIPMTWLNERNNARIYYVLTRAMEEVLPFQNCNQVKWQSNFKLVHCIGRTNTDKPVKDDRFNVSLDQTIRLIRRVEML